MAAAAVVLVAAAVVAVAAWLRPRRSSWRGLAVAVAFADPSATATSTLP